MQEKGQLKTIKMLMKTIEELTVKLGKAMEEKKVLLTRPLNPPLFLRFASLSGLDARSASVLSGTHSFHSTLALSCHRQHKQTVFFNSSNHL